jgi:SAM-dependent methyltransferase
MTYTYEESVVLLRNQPDQDDFVKNCYLDDPLINSANRFLNSPEWLSISKKIKRQPGLALEIGAGRGIASYALSKNGWTTFAIEPDSSSIVGAKAIDQLSKESKTNIIVLRGFGESIPFPDNTFDLVYIRQVLHHAVDIDQFCQEVARILKDHGKFLITREHVISKEEDLFLFLDNHPLHKYHQTENAYLISDYLGAIKRAGLTLKQILGPYDDAINYFPMSYEIWRLACIQPLSKYLGYRIPRIITHEKFPFCGVILRYLARYRSSKENYPGRLYSFLAQK